MHPQAGRRRPGRLHAMFDFDMFDFDIEDPGIRLETMPLPHTRTRRHGG